MDDTARFLARCRAWLEPGQSVTIGRAPGRLDAFGGVIDYTGGTVCEMPLAIATHAAIQPRADRQLRIVSLEAAAHGLATEVTWELDQLVPPGAPRPYEDLRAELTADPATAWAAYVAGAWGVLATEGEIPGFATGASVVIGSEVPFGAGVSSSAAVEIATLYALAAHLALNLDGQRLAHLGQRVENRVVGAPCGLMDQLTVALGRRDSLLVIRCQPDQVVANEPLPPGVRVGAIHTGVKHAVGGSHYTQARCAAFMGHRIIVDHLRGIGTCGPDEDPFEGYLARIPAGEFAHCYAALLPETIGGAAFLARYGATVDPVTQVDPGVDYRVAAAARHHVLDNARAAEFIEALASYGRTAEPVFLKQAGEAMLAGHAGYRDDLGLGADEADLLVELGLRHGPAAGVYGARITGGGCGGSVAFLGDERLPDLLPVIAAEYAARSGELPAVLLGSSDGAAAWGTQHRIW